MEEIISHHLSPSAFFPALPKSYIPKLPLPSSQNAPPPPRPRPVPLLSSLRSPVTFTQKPPKSPQIPFFSEKLLFLDSVGLDHLSVISSHPPIISASLADLKSTVKFLRSLDLTALDLRRIVGMCPQILTATPRTLTSVITFLLREAGVSGRDLRHVIHRRPRLLMSDVATQLRPTLYFLQMLGITETSRHSYLLSCSVEEKLIPRIEFFESAGFSLREAKSMLRRFPQLFCYGIEGNLAVKLGFLVGEMGRELREVNVFPQYFSYSLEKRIKRRHLVCEERGVRFTLPVLLKPSDEEFRERVEVCVGSTPPVRNSPLWHNKFCW